MQSVNTPQCGICQEPYNDSNRAPRAVCTNYHNICSECLGNMLKTFGEKLICPFDRLESDKKSLSGYPINIELLNFIQPANGQPIISHKNCSSCSDEATRLCLQCNEIQCNSCILENHEEHKKVKLTDMTRFIAEKKSLLYETVSQLEVSISGKGAKRFVEIKENELKEKADAIFENYQRILDDKKEALFREIKKTLAEKSSEFLAKKPQKNKKKNDEIYKWINETKSLTHNGKNRMDNHSVLCTLYKQEELLKSLDMSELEAKETKDDILLNKVLNQVTIQANTVFLENFKKSLPVKIEQNNFEEVKFDVYSSGGSAQKSTNARSSNSPPSFKDSESEISDHSNFDYQFEPFILNQGRNSLSSVHSRNQSLQQVQGSEWIEKGSKLEQNPIQEDIQKLRRAFEDANIEAQVRFVKASNAIRVDSMYDKIKSPTSGFKNDEELKAFFNVIHDEELASSFKKVISLNLTCMSLTRNGIIHLSKVVEKLSSLEVLRVEFFKSGDLKHEDMKPFMQTLGRCKSLSTLSLSCQKWKYLQNFNFSYTIGDLALIGKLKDLNLNFSECHGLTINGITEAFHGFSSLVSLEDLKISFNGCSRVDDDEDCLKSIYQVYSKMAKLQKIEFDFLRCPGFSERGVRNLTGPSKVNAGLVVQVNI